MPVGVVVLSLHCRPCNSLDFLDLFRYLLGFLLIVDITRFASGVFEQKTQ
jgi:hypothetical protein